MHFYLSPRVQVDGKDAEIARLRRRIRELQLQVGAAAGSGSRSERPPDSSSQH